MEANERIKEAVGDSAPLFVVSPTLEAVLGIGRNAKDKPRKIAEALETKPLDEIPTPLLSAVRAIVPKEPIVRTGKESKDK